MVLADGKYHLAIPMTAKITIDKAGRVVIPKPLRQRLRLGPGDVLELRSEGECITLQPVRPQAPLKKEHGIWVYEGEATDTSIADLLDRERGERIRDLRR
jgi:AbrB family looped-hinge helix DNA binding protein